MKKLSTIVAIILIVATILPFYFVRKHLIENEKPKVETIAAYPEPDFAKIMFMGLNAFAADLLFARSQYYYGSHYVTDMTYLLLEQMIRVVLALNPSLEYAIPFGEAAISSMRTESAIESANSLLRLGHELYPDDYYYVFNQGYNYFIYLNDIERAYPLMYEAVNMKNAPSRVIWLVNHIATMGGGYRLGYEYTKERLEKTKDKNMRDQFEKELQHFANLIVLSEAAEEYYKKYKKSPDKELKELVKSNLIKEIPKDVYGGEYYYDEKDRIVKTTTQGDRQYTRKQTEKQNKEEEKAKKEKENSDKTEEKSSEGKETPK
ncbi:hypothetical protein J5690_01860 [bacterium]|nr:hypothetical protein [bacterium]